MSDDVHDEEPVVKDALQNRERDDAIMIGVIFIPGAIFICLFVYFLLNIIGCLEGNQTVLLCKILF